MILEDAIDRAIERTSTGRIPCLECALKHLGTAWFLRAPTPLDPAVLLARASILLSEAASGYPTHRHLAIGILNYLEQFSHDRAAARAIRRAVFHGSTDLSGYPLPASVPPPPSALRAAHLEEAAHESPIQIDTTLPEEALIERLGHG